MGETHYTRTVCHARFQYVRVFCESTRAKRQCERALVCFFAESCAILQTCCGKIRPSRFRHPDGISITRVASWHGLPREKHCRCRDKMHGVICCFSAVEPPSPEASRILPARMKSPWRRQRLSPSRPHVCADKCCPLAVSRNDFCAPNIVAISVLAPRMEEAVRSVFEVFSLFNVRM